jgi:hypothetical protein
LLDPYAYYRVQEWYCWKFGAEGSCFWAFGDAGGSSSWNEYSTGKGSYTPLFIDQKTIASGKQMEAIREGIEDYEYLRMLRDRINSLDKANIRGPSVDSACQLLSSAVDRVVGPIQSSMAQRWRAPKDRSTADQVRLEIVEHLTELTTLDSPAKSRR